MNKLAMFMLANDTSNNGTYELKALYANPEDNTLHTKKNFTKIVGYSELFDIFKSGCYILWNDNRYIPICYKTVIDNGYKYKTLTIIDTDGTTHTFKSDGLDIIIN